MRPTTLEDFLGQEHLRSEEHTSELQSQSNIVCRLLLEKKKTEIVRAAIKSYRDLPKMLYHIQWKFRDEVRRRFGVMRGREFLMKDAYSFDLDDAAPKRS